MPRNICRKIKQEIKIWRVGAMPGIVVLGLVIIGRLSGSLQFLEWITLDSFLRLRPAEIIDERVVIIGIDEADIQNVGTYPIPDQEIAVLLRKLQQYKPRVIGLDIVRDLPVEPGHTELVKVFKENKNIIGVEKVLPIQIAPPLELPAEQIGFVDFIPDTDGQVRRSILGMRRPETPQNYVFSLSLVMAKSYLASEGFTLENGNRDPSAMQFGSTELPRFFANSGGYVKADEFGVQVLVNFRSGSDRFRRLSLEDIKEGNFNPSWIRDRIIVIGITAPSIKDLINTSAIANLNPPGKIYGVEFHAHVTSQIVSAVLDRRPLLKTWSEGWEYLWIFVWGFLAIGLGRLTQSPLNNLLYVSLTSFILVVFSYGFLIAGWWIPVAPALLILILHSVGLSAFSFYQHDQALKSQLNERQHTIEQTFNVIHNGPLQTLADVLRRLRDQDLPQEKLLLELENLNYEIRAIGEDLQREALAQEESIRLGSGLKLDLKRPIHELFYEVYSSTLERNLRYFQTLKVKARSFKPIEPRYLSIKQKRELCLFLEEALCNVGKHAQGVTRLTVIGIQNEGLYTLSVKDNGSGICSSAEGQGTKQCRKLAKQLGGEFKRESLGSKGTLCELNWLLIGTKGRFTKIRYIVNILVRQFCRLG